jgi:DNA uptake protein ComE-like DNA-binding protein
MYRKVNSNKITNRIVEIFLFCYPKMKKAFKSFISFTRAERIGLVCLLALLLILIIIRTTMSLWVHPKIDTEKERKLIAAWESFKQNQPAKHNTSINKNVYKNTYDDTEIPLPATIDLNTADSATLVRFKGIGPVTAGKIVAHRNRKGPFTDINQLKEVGSFSTATFDTLKRHLIIIPATKEP